MLTLAPKFFSTLLPFSPCVYIILRYIPIYCVRHGPDLYPSLNRHVLFQCRTGGSEEKRETLRGEVGRVARGPGEFCSVIAFKSEHHSSSSRLRKYNEGKE